LLIAQALVEGLSLVVQGTHLPTRVPVAARSVNRF
jgi:hypothetical protein